jgi:hypothetical protein
VKGLSSSYNKTFVRIPYSSSGGAYHANMLVLFLESTYGRDLALVDVGAGSVGGDIAPGDRGEPESSGRGGGPGRETGKYGRVRSGRRGEVGVRCGGVAVVVQELAGRVLRSSPAPSLRKELWSTAPPTRIPDSRRATTGFRWDVSFLCTLYICQHH